MPNLSANNDWTCVAQVYLRHTIYLGGNMPTVKATTKPTTIEATQWFKNGDHPLDACEIITGEEGDFLSEGKIVRYYRLPDCNGQDTCARCGKIMHIHGWIDTGTCGYVVCPGDWIVTRAENDYHPYQPDEFLSIYDIVEYL
jgi:hypothetical protein